MSNNFLEVLESKHKKAEDNLQTAKTVCFRAQTNLDEYEKSRWFWNFNSAEAKRLKAHLASCEYVLTHAKESVDEIEKKISEYNISESKFNALKTEFFQLKQTGKVNVALAQSLHDAFYEYIADLRNQKDHYALYSNHWKVNELDRKITSVYDSYIDTIYKHVSFVIADGVEVHYAKICEKYNLTDKCYSCGIMFDTNNDGEAYWRCSHEDEDASERRVCLDCRG